MSLIRPLLCLFVTVGILTILVFDVTATGGLRGLIGTTAPPVRDAEGFWGPKTAIENWCEADYHVSPYIAEFWNTLSSLPIVLWGVFGLHKHSTLRLEFRFVLSLALFVVVGLGSMAFHCTLLRVSQLADELPMLMGNSVFLYVILTMGDPMGTSRPRLACVLAALTMIPTVMAMYGQYSVFLVSYASIVLLIITLNIRVVKCYGGAPLLYSAFGLYALGLCVWFTERTFCGQVQGLQLHAIWHLLSGSGTYMLIVFWIFVRCAATQRTALVSGHFPLNHIQVDERRE
jgi:dihydroceramidase